METRDCQNCKKGFEITSEDFSFYEKVKVPPPSWCPSCRLKRRFAHRNERTLYKRVCDLCKQNIISIYSPKSPYIVYCPKCWHGDGWDPSSYGRDYDFSKNFFEQYMEVDRATPHLALLQENNVESPWVNYETDDKNCYLNFGGHFNEDSAYNQYALKSKDAFDNFWMIHGEFSYGNTLCESAYQNFNSIFCFESREIWFSFDCRNCSNIIGCSGLRHKQYHIFNKPVTKEEYKAFCEEYLSGSREKYEALEQKAHDFWKTVPARAVFIERSVNCSGNLIKDSKNSHNCFAVDRCENIAHSMFNLELKDAQDSTSVWKTELSYELLAGINATNLFFSSHLLSQCSHIYYSNMLFSSNNCFGCSHLKKGEYAILNKQYSKEEYHALKAKIIEHMNADPFIDRKGRVYKFGEFLPYEASAFNYNESVANEYFPLTDTEIEAEGANQFDHAVETNYDFEVITPPDLITDVDESILQKALKCADTGKLFKLIAMELAFYKRFKLPIPTRSPFARHQRRLKFFSGHMSLQKRVCGSCGKEIDSVYQQEEFPIVYCEACFQENIL